MSSALKIRLTWAVLGVWATLLVVLIASLMINHTIAMPSPSNAEQLAAGVDALVETSDGRTLVHVIYDDCSCTSGLLDHLAERGVLTDTAETIVFVGGDAEREEQLTARGFSWITTNELRLEQELALVSAPVLIVHDPEDGMRYAGGYYRLPAAVRPMDLAIIAALDEGREPEPLPVFGCAVNAELRSQLDPFGLQR